MNNVLIAVVWLAAALLSFVLVQVLSEGFASDEEIAANAIMCLFGAPIILPVSLIIAFAMLFYKICSKIAYLIDDLKDEKY